MAARSEHFFLASLHLPDAGFAAWVSAVELTLRVSGLLATGAAVAAEADDEETRNVTTTSAAPQAAAKPDLGVCIGSLSPSGRTTGRDPIENVVVSSRMRLPVVSIE